jgi:hypothetical protein
LTQPNAVVGHTNPFRAEQLARRGAHVEQFVFSSQSVGRVGRASHLALRNRLLWLPADDDLLPESGRVRFRESAPGEVRRTKGTERWASG